MIYLSSLV